jgi:hypothetical protein
MQRSIRCLATVNLTFGKNSLLVRGFSGVDFDETGSATGKTVTDDIKSIVLEIIEKAVNQEKGNALPKNRIVIFH